MSEPRPPELPDERDAWLHQALRHAPDATAAPPNALREAILAEARSAVHSRPRRAAGPSFLDHAAVLWAWLARPPVAASFASIMAATLVGMMWWDRPMEDDRRPAPTTVSSRVAAPAPTLPPSQPAPMATDAIPSLASTPAPVTQSAAAPPPPDAATAKRAEAAPAKMAPAAVDAAKSRSDAPASPALQSAPRASPFPGNGSSESSALAEPLRDERRQAAPSPVRKAESDAPNGAQGSLAALAKPASPARERVATARRDKAEATDALAAGAATAPQAFAAAPPTAAAPALAPTPERQDLRAAAKASPRPMAALLASIAQAAARWVQQAADGTKPIDASAAAWLANVDTATAGRWQSADGRDTPTEGSAQASAFALRLDRDGRAAAIVRIEDAGVFFRQDAGAAWFAPLPADAIARLRAALPR